MLAQAVTGTPGHINSMALAVGHVLDAYPPETMKEGDVYIHNDPWMGTGHLNDISLTTQCFHEGRLVGFLACNSHVMDIGGIADRSSSKDVFMEGLYLPILKIFDAGKVDESLMAVIRANTRQPVETVGDVYSLVNCNAIGCERLTAMMEEFGLSALDELAEHIIETSRSAVVEKIRALPQGTWHGELTLDGRDEPIELKASLTVGNDEIVVDYAGSAPMTKRNFNVPICYTLAYTSYALGVALFGDIPNNAGSLAPRRVTAPEGCILNALKPAAVFARSQMGLMLPDLVYACLRQAIPDRIPAENTCGLWGINVMGPWDSPARIWNRYRTQVMTTGGMGALPYRDGMSATGFPSGVRGGPVEIFEQMSTLIVWKKELRPDSGGPGVHRGGLGQWIEIENGLPEPFDFFAGYERINNPAKGADGGLAGAPGELRMTDGTRPGGKTSFAVPPGQRIVVKSSGGGGCGDPTKRDRDAVRRDLEHGLISAEAARDIYGLTG